MCNTVVGNQYWITSSVIYFIKLKLGLGDKIIQYFRMYKNAKETYSNRKEIVKTSQGKNLLYKMINAKEII